MDIFITIMRGIFAFVKYPLFLLVGLIFLFLLSYTFYTFLYIKQGKRFKKGSYKKLKKRPALLRIFIDAPKQYALDCIDLEPDFFRPQGMILFEGEQGAGKTSSMVKYALDLQYSYPKAKVISNCGFTKQNTKLNDWRQLIDYENGKLGVVVMIDELQNWFSSNQSKNFPPEMLQVVTTNRKNRRVIIGSCQNFYMVAKNIRTQTTEVRSCFTLLGCLTIVRRRKPICDTDGNVKEWKGKGYYFHVHNKELRESYDTWLMIKSLRHSGFQQKQPEVVFKNYVTTNK